MGRRKKSWGDPSNDLERARFQLRIDRIKTVPFLAAFDKVALGVDYDASRLPYHIVCPLPDHYERSGSFYLQRHRWFCFGCQRGGDVIDFAQHYHEVQQLAKAIKLVERCLDLLETEEVDEADLALKATIARAESKPYSAKEWERAVYEIHDEFLEQTRPFTRCADPWVYDLAWSYADLVYEELDLAMKRPPRTPRGRRTRLKALAEFARGWAWGMERDVERLTGKDVLDCALQGWGYRRILSD